MVVMVVVVAVESKKNQLTLVHYGEEGRGGVGGASIFNLISQILFFVGFTRLH